MKNYKAIGLMSGTSCDGLDIAYCEFVFDTEWKYKIVKSKMVEYSLNFQEKLKNALNFLNPNWMSLILSLGSFLDKKLRSL